MAAVHFTTKPSSAEVGDKIYFSWAGGTPPFQVKLLDPNGYPVVNTSTSDYDYTFDSTSGKSGVYECVVISSGETHTAYKFELKANPDNVVELHPETAAEPNPTGEAIKMAYTSHNLPVFNITVVGVKKDNCNGSWKIEASTDGVEWFVVGDNENIMVTKAVMINTALPYFRAVFVPAATDQVGYYEFNFFGGSVVSVE